jgi:hypothetical protein
VAKQARAYPGDRVTVELAREEAARGRRPDAARLRAIASTGAVTEPARAGVYDLGTRYAYDTYPGIMPVSKFTQTSLETSVLFNATHQLQLRGYLLNFLDTVEVAHSGRTIPNAYRFQVNPETTGTATDLLYHQHGVTRRFPVAGSGKHWGEAVAVATRLAKVEAALEDPKWAPARQDLLAARERLTRERDERWDTLSRTRRGKEGTAAANLTDGKWAIGLDSLRHYQPFQTWDTENFKVTAGAAFARAEVAAPTVRVGRLESTWTDVLTAPQMHQYTVAWHALYLVGTLWFFSLTAFATLGTFLERLPFYPYAYDLSRGAFHASNATAVQYMVSQTATVARMKAFDLAVQVWSPLFFIILVARVGGRVVMAYRNIPARSLCAVLKTRYQGGEPSVRYVWRKTTLVRDNSVFDFLSYADQDVIPYDVLSIENGPPLPERPDNL